VLVARDESGAAYVVGVLRALRAAPSQETLRAEGVETPRVFETRVEGERTVLSVPAGDLVLEAARGRVELRGAEGVHVSSEGDVALDALGHVSLRSRDAEGNERSGLHLRGDAAELRAGLLTAKAGHLHALAERVTLVASRADSHLERLRVHAEEIETEAGKLVEKAKESYRSVEGLAQTQAGRLKLVAETTLTALAERAKLRAKRVFAIDGESIHLG
jgi:hypothetical protein